MSIYLAGPIAHADDGGSGWREEIIESYPNTEFNNPLDAYDAAADDLEIDPNPVGPNQVSAEAIVESDKELLRESDAVLVGYSDIQSVGTPMEIMWSYERDYPIVMWLRDGSILPDLSPWYQHHADFVTSKMGHAVSYLERR